MLLYGPTSRFSFVHAVDGYHMLPEFSSEIKVASIHKINSEKREAFTIKKLTNRAANVLNSLNRANSI